MKPHTDSFLLPQRQAAATSLSLRSHHKAITISAHTGQELRRRTSLLTNANGLSDDTNTCSSLPALGSCVSTYAMHVPWYAASQCLGDLKRCPL